MRLRMIEMKKMKFVCADIDSLGFGELKASTLPLRNIMHSAERIMAVCDLQNAKFLDFSPSSPLGALLSPVEHSVKCVPE